MIDWSEVHLSNYESAVFGMFSWRTAAKKLFMSAKVLEPHVLEMWESYRAASKGDGELKPDYHQGVYFMLIAYAIENILKAMIVRRFNYELKKSFRENKKFPSLLKDHDLMALCKTAGVSVNLEEEDLLRRLDRSSVWYGRYPAPLDYKELSGVEQFTNGDEYSVSWFGGNDVEKINALFKELFSFIGESNT